jgi:tRNA (guanine37-N1)-methyltransferase
MHFHIITLFPEAFDSYLKESIIGRAIKQKRIKVTFVNPRTFVTGKYKRVWPDGNVSLVVDDKPFGGGPGMIIRAEPVLKAVESVMKKIEKRKNPPTGGVKVKIINFSPSGEKFTTAYAKTAAQKYTDIVMLCGRYEGIDARVAKILKAEEISIGDYVLTGGELPAMVLVDCMARQIPGVLGTFDSLEEGRISSSEFYTRPEVLEWKGKKHKVPPVLLSGDHKKIEEWKKGTAEK